MKRVLIATNFKPLIKHLIKLLSYETDVNLLKFRRRTVKVDF